MQGAVMRAKITDKSTGYVICGNWAGGPYIDLSFDTFGADPFDVIDVWDYETNTLAIPFYREEMRREMRDWLAENRDNLAGYWEMMRGY